MKAVYFSKTPCVPGDTLVLTSLDGTQFKPISELGDSDKVVSYNYYSMTNELCDILDMSVGLRDHIVTYITEDGSMIRCTKDHSLGIEDKGWNWGCLNPEWTSLEGSTELKIGSELCTLNGFSKIKSITIDELPDGIEVYNLVTQFSNSYLKSPDSSNFIFSHNEIPDDIDDMGGHSSSVCRLNILMVSP